MNVQNLQAYIRKCYVLVNFNIIKLLNPIGNKVSKTRVTEKCFRIRDTLHIKEKYYGEYKLLKNINSTQYQANDSCFPEECIRGQN